MNIPVFHDDQHGTAIISSAGLINALHAGRQEDRGDKDRRQRRRCRRHRLRQPCHLPRAEAGKPDHVRHQGGHLQGTHRRDEQVQGALCRRHRAAHPGRGGRGGRRLIGLSAKGAFTPEMVRKMAANPIIFAMANPDPEITPEEAHAVRGDVIIATGRSDYPNQVNNVLGFPFIFRGALDVRATHHQRGDEEGGGLAPWPNWPARNAPIRSAAPTATSSSPSAATTSSRSRSTRGPCCGWRRPSPRPPWIPEWRASRSRTWTSTSSIWRRCREKRKKPCA